MPLLGIGKKQEQQGAEQKQEAEVPDELPDLPDSSAQESSETGEAPGELPPIDSTVPGQELAPDELPPVGDTEAGPELPMTDDKKLYFSSLLQKLHEEGIKSTKLSMPTANLLTDMKKHWKEQKRAAEIEDQMKEVAESITPLQKLEQEWVALQEDIEQKKTQLHEKEEEIRKLADQAKSAAQRAERMKKSGK